MGEISIKKDQNTEKSQLTSVVQEGLAKIKGAEFNTTDPCERKNYFSSLHREKDKREQKA